jgi:hypothetical protein
MEDHYHSEKPPKKPRWLLLLILPICILSIVCIILGIYLYVSSITITRLIDDKHELSCTILKLSERIIQLERNTKVNIVSTDINIGDASSFMTEEALLRFTIRQHTN